MKHFQRTASFIVATIVYWAWALGSCACYSQTHSRPNVLFIAVDDMRCELGCYGSEFVKSPQIDQLAKSGVVFRRAYCQQAVCNPSRVSLMTGLRPDQTKVWDLKTEMRTMIPDVVTLPQHFQRFGYRAVAYGKIFHNPFPDAKSWDEPTHNASDVIGYSEENRNRLVQFRESMRRRGLSSNAMDAMRGPATEVQLEPDEKNFDGKQTLDAIDKLKELASSPQPFFLAVGYIRPHLPFITPKRYWDLYDRKTIPIASNAYLPKNMPSVSFGDRSMGGFYELRGYMDYADAPSPFESILSVEQQRELKHGYYASVSFVDTQIGLLLRSLQDLKLEENTIVVLWSDHGWKLGEHGGWCKQTNFEIDTRIPLIFRVPGTKGIGQSSNSIVELIDIYPTLCEAAGIPVPKELQGTSLMPILQSPTTSVKDCAISQFPRKHRGKDYMGYAIRTDHHRFVIWLDAMTGEVAARELYDHRIDPNENDNIAESTSSLSTMESHEKLLWHRLPKPTFPLPIATASNNTSPPLELLHWNTASSTSELPKSVAQGEFQSVLFENERSEEVKLVWNGPGGNEKVYATLAIGDTFRIRTRPGIVWSIQSADGSLLGYFVVKSSSAESIRAKVPARSE